MTSRRQFKILSIIILIFFLLTFSAVTAQAQNTAESSSNQYLFFVAPIAEVNMQGWDISYGGGLSIGGGDGVTIGTNIYYFFDSNNINILEITIFMRFFILGNNVNYGPFFQLITGTVIYERDNFTSIPADIGSMSVGVGFGWRFLLANRWFAEPAIRAGYPYILGMGVSTGILF